MKVLSTIFFILLSTVATASPPMTQTLLGKWRIDLRPSPDAQPYWQTFTIDSIEGNSFTGKFYGTAFDNGILNTQWGKVYFAFSTTDNRTQYNHSGELNDGTLIGKTHAPGRNMLSIWRGVKINQ